jgi:hypothetical protein
MILEATASGMLATGGTGRLYGPLSFEGVGHFRSGGTATASGITESSALTVDRALDDILVVWGIQDTSVAAEWMKTRALHDLNAAFQRVWLALQDMGFTGANTLDVTFTNTGEAVLPTNVQKVLGNVRLASGAPLLPLRSRGQLQAYANIYGEGSPVAFFVESEASAGGAEAVTTRLHIVPPAGADAVAVKVDVIVEPPRFTWADYARRTVLSIPHQFAESCLLPICRYLASGSSLFWAKDQKGQIDADYQAALQMLRLSDPDGDAVTRADEKRDTGKEAVTS